jgi:hypothetical protein
MKPASRPNSRKQYSSNQRMKRSSEILFEMWQRHTRPRRSRRALERVRRPLSRRGGRSSLPCRAAWPGLAGRQRRLARAPSSAVALSGPIDGRAAAPPLARTRIAAMAHADALVPKVGASTQHPLGLARPGRRRVAGRPGRSRGAARPRRGVSGPHDRQAGQDNRQAYRNALHRGDLQAANGPAVCATGVGWQRNSLSPTRVRDPWPRRATALCGPALRWRQPGCVDRMARRGHARRQR